MKATQIIAVVVGCLTSSVACCESAHKGWVAYPDSPNQYASGSSPKVEMATEFVHLRQPDPETNSAFTGSVWVKEKDTVTVERVYLLTAEDTGILNSREVKVNVVNPRIVGLTRGEYGIRFQTEKTGFAKQDVFAVVLKWNGTPTVLFLRIGLQVVYS
jgi:hypothetical protein